MHAGLEVQIYGARLANN